MTDVLSRARAAVAGLFRIPMPDCCPHVDPTDTPEEDGNA